MQGYVSFRSSVGSTSPIETDNGVGFGQVAFGPNAQRALHMIGLGEALDSVSGGRPENESDDVWFDVYVGEKGREVDEKLCSVTGKDSAKGSVHRSVLEWFLLNSCQGE